MRKMILGVVVGWGDHKLRVAVKVGCRRGWLGRCVRHCPVQLEGAGRALKAAEPAPTQVVKFEAPPVPAKRTAIQTIGYYLIHCQSAGGSVCWDR
eukprot:5026749-Amphidinium_carterae.1